MSDDLPQPPSSSYRFGEKMTATEQAQIIHDYALYIEIDPPGGGMEIRDASCLPHPKQRIKDAFVRELLIEMDEKRLDLLRARKGRTALWPDPQPVPPWERRNRK